MRNLLEQSLLRLQNGARVVWCVILSASGSTPRDAGTKMAVFEDGSTWGTVGGGAVELQATAFARTLGARAAMQSYDLASGSEGSTGMICGGIVELGFLPFSPADAPRLASMLEELRAPEDQWLQIDVNADGSFQLSLLRASGFHGPEQALPVSACLERASDGTLRLTEPVQRNYMCYLFGGGHVCRALTPLLGSLGFPVTVFDDRPAILTPEYYPGARLMLGDYEAIASRVQITRRDYVVVMTPEHSMDLTVLQQVLRTPAGYVGCIGSRRKTAYVNRVLQEQGFSDKEIARIHAPIGLPIGAKTPEEIAVSIAAEMIRHRAAARTEAT